MKITELVNGRVFIEADKNKILTNDSGSHFDTVILSKSLMDTIVEIDQPSEYWGMNLMEMFPDSSFEKQRKELARILGAMDEAKQSVESIMNEMQEMKIRNK